MKIELDHIGIAVNDLQSVLNTLKSAFGLDASASEEVPDQKIRITDFNLNGTVIEYFEPTADDSPVNKFLQKRGNGMHHIALKVENVDTMLKTLKKKRFSID